MFVRVDIEEFKTFKNYVELGQNYYGIKSQKIVKFHWNLKLKNTKINRKTTKIDFRPEKRKLIAIKSLQKHPFSSVYQPKSVQHDSYEMHRSQNSKKSTNFSLKIQNIKYIKHICRKLINIISRQVAIEFGIGQWLWV